eukprot:gene1050-1113_t
MADRIPRAIRLLSHYGGAALQSSVVRGKYFGPMVPTRIAAKLRKTAIIEGTYGNFKPLIGGWDPSWDRHKKFHLIKPLKGHIRERTREARATKIDNAMKAMPDKIKKYHQEAKERKPKKNAIWVIKKLTTKKYGPPSHHQEKK